MAGLRGSAAPVQAGPAMPRRSRLCERYHDRRTRAAQRSRRRSVERTRSQATRVPARRRRRRPRRAPARAPSRATCCSTARRAAATRPTRRSTRSSRSACSCRGATTTCARRSRSAASSACRCCRAAPAARNAGRRSARRSSSITASISTAIVAFDRDAMTVDRRARRRARRAQRVAASRTASGFRSTSARRRRRRSAAWPATTRAARARSPTATWCTTCWRSTRCSPTAREARFGPEARDGGGAAARRASSCGGLRAIGARERDEIERSVPKVMRRVGGYNIDVFRPQSERPYTRDGSVNYAHLLVGSEGTLAWTRELTLKLAPLPVHRALGVVNFPTLYRAMECARHIVELGPSAVELVDRTMIDLARGNPAFRPVIDARADRRARRDPARRVHRRRRASAARARLDDLVALMGDLGLPGSVVRDDRRRRAEGAVGRAQGRAQHHDEHEGRRQAGVVHRGLRGAARASRRLRRPADARCSARHGTRGTWYAHASVGTLHVRPILDMRRDGAAKMRAIAEEASAMVREYKGAFSGEHGDGLVRSEWVALAVRAAADRARSRRSRTLFDPGGPHESRQDRARRRGWTTRRCSAFRPGYRTLPLDTGARLVGVERARTIPRPTR